MPTPKKRLIRGVDDFQKFIDRKGYFIDKTLLIQEILDNPHEVLLIPRPRRFGKSLNLSMLRYFFDCTLTNTAQLFEPYQIWQAGEQYTELQGQFPVIEVNLKDIKEENFSDCTLALKYTIAELFSQHKYLLQSDRLDEFDKAEMIAFLTKKADLTDCKSSLFKLSKWLHLHHQKKVLLLIDEYDSPIIVGYRNGYYRQIINFMRPFLGKAFKTNPYLYRGVITGILRIAKESIFSELNNLGIATLLNHHFADKFGFTESETKALLQHFQLQDQFSDIKYWYDGYTVGTTTHLYNPWSITGYIYAPQEGFRPHWVNTSSDELLRERIVERNALDTRNIIEQLLEGKSVEKRVERNMVFADFSTNKELFWTLLVFSGYLTPSHRIKEGIYALRIPNYEIHILFRKFILDWLGIGMNVQVSTLLNLINTLSQNRIKAFEKHFKQIMSDTFSYFDVNKQAEKVWQAYVLGLLAIGSDEYIIKSNRESGDGRYDILMIPRTDKNLYGVVMEIKAMDKKATATQIDKMLSQALAQIQSNQYYKELIAHDIPKRTELAVVFVGKELYIKSKM